MSIKRASTSGVATAGAGLGANTFTGAQKWATAAAIASAATVNLNAATTGNRAHITGTVAITAWTLTGGPFTVIFDAATPLTYHATTNRLNSGATSYTTTAGDTADIYSDGTTVFVNITKVAGTSVASAAVTQIPTLTATVASNAMTIGLASLSLDFRSTTLGSGTVTTVTAAPTSIVIPSGATLGTANGIGARFIVGVMNNAGTAELFIANSASINTFDLSETGLISTTILDAASDLSTIAYSTTARTGLAYRLIGYIAATQVTAGTWASAPINIQGYGGRVMEESRITDSRVLGTKWNLRTSAANNSWWGVAWNGTVFAAVAYSGTGNRVMTSPDGITWTIQTSAADNNWFGIAWNGTVFAAVAVTGTGNRVMTSPDGITWTIRTSAADNSWRSIAWNGTVFAAVAYSGVGNRVMTSPDGITWTIRTSAADNSWAGVAWNGTVFAAVAYSGTGNRVMTSPDGITWTIQTSAADNAWQAIAWNGTVFAAVANTGTANRVMTSPDGITWTIQATATATEISWRSIAWNGTVFAAVASDGTGNNRVMTSPDGITWTIRTSAADNEWVGVAWNGTVFASVSSSGTGNRVMTSV